MFNARIEVTGGGVIEQTTVSESTRFSTNAIGGFGSCDFDLDGMWPETKIPYLSTVRLYWGTALVWEGRIEDSDIDVVKAKTTFGCQGFKRALDWTSVRRVWSTRSQQFVETSGGDGYSLVAALGMTKTSRLAVTTGNFDPTDPTRSGVEIVGTGQAVVVPQANGAWTVAPIGVYWKRCYANINVTGPHYGIGAGGMAVDLYALDSAGVYAGAAAGWDTSVGETTFTVDLTAVSAFVNRVAWLAGPEGVPGAGCTPTAADIAQIYNIRLLGSTVTEDVSGGFYGGTLINNLLTLVPDLAVGLVEAGSDFTIQSLDYSDRGYALDIVNAIAAFYAREWGVWDDRRFDWKTPNLDEAQWIVNVKDCTALNIKGSVDGLARTAYVLYTDAASGLTGEQSSASTSRRNPHVRQGVTKDEILQAPAMMTSNTAAQLAARASADHGAWPPVSGSVTLPAEALITSAVGSAKPAFLIRAGCNIQIPDLPKSDLFAQGRDGQTLFHVISTEADTQAGTVTLGLEGQQTYMDVLTARLAAATRTLTG